MPANDETMRLVLDIVGEDGIERLEKSTANYRALLEALGQSFRDGDLTAEEFERQQKKLSSELERQTRTLQGLKAAQAQAEQAARDLADGTTAAAEAARLQAEADRADIAAVREATRETEEWEDAQRRVNAALRDLTTSTNVAATATGKVAAATDKVAKSGRSMGRTMLESGRIVQDFFQGGFLGVLNNIEGLTMALGLGSGLAGALTIVGVALMTVGPQIAGFFRGLVEGSNEVPRATDALGRIDDRLKAVVKQLDAYRDKQSLTNRELADYNKLSEEQVRLEGEKAKALEAAARMKKFNEEDRGKTADEAERAELFGDTLGTPEQRKGLADSIYQALSRERKQEAEERLARAKQTHQEELAKGAFGYSEQSARRVKEAEAAVAAEEKALRDTANRLASQATIEGSKEATERIKQIQQLKPDAFTDFQKFAVENADPAARREEEQVIERQQRMARLDKDIKAKEEREAKERRERDIDEIDRANREEASSIEEAQEAAAGETKTRTAAEKIQAEQNKAGIKRQIAEEDASIKRGGYVEFAQQIAAQVKEAGGATDRFGRFHKLNEDQQFDYVQAQVARHLHRETGQLDRFGRPVRANPGLGKDRTNDIATKVTAMANQANREQMGTNRAMLGAMNELLATQQAMAGEMKRQRQGFNQVARGARKARVQGATRLDN